MKTNLIAVILILSAIYTEAQTNKWSFKEAHSLGLTLSLRIKAVDSDISIYADDVDQTTVYFVVKRNGQLLTINMSELQEYFHIQNKSSDNSLFYDIRPTQKNKLLKWNNKLVVDIEIVTPIKTSCQIKTVDGDLKMINLQGDQYCKTTDGDVIIESISGKLMAASVDGDISAKQIIGDVILDAVDGDVRIKDVSGRLNLKSVDGDINMSNVKGSARCVTVDGDIIGNFHQILAPCDFNTIDGDIKLKVPKKTSFNIEMHGESLQCDLDNFNGINSDKYIYGEVNGGGNMVFLKTIDGDIHVVAE